MHVAVVDPGVGSKRGAIAIQTARYVFLGPDNGLLSLAVAREKVVCVHHLVNARFFRDTVSFTFHGRDIFAPVAAQLAAGLPVTKLGPKQRGFVRLKLPQPRSWERVLLSWLTALE